MNSLKPTECDRRDESRCELCPLSRVKAGVAVRIRQLCAAPELQNRLRELGLGEDQIIKLPGLQRAPGHQPAVGATDPGRAGPTGSNLTGDVVPLDRPALPPGSRPGYF